MEEIIPEDKDASLENALASLSSTIVTNAWQVKDEIYLYDLTGKRITRLAPDLVGAAHLDGRRGNDHFFATLTGFTSPGTVAKYDFKVPLADGAEDHSARWSVYRSTTVKGLDLDQFEASQVWYESADGTKVPMFVVKQKSTLFDGTAPAVQYGYGGFSISVPPFFSAFVLTFLQMYGAILAVPSIRGGGEFGEDWHQATIREKKVNSFNDFIAATQFLVENKYAAPGKVTLHGGSNGGSCILAVPQNWS
ncbi:hypothetical protein EUX98_g4400 [Antrodiella citrinella]|uniref:Prolyl endopeptidase n=1 Tax=Antrodiella citrinella TaxID=2447956 RepID=A0A4S4MV08_9APHY|nr:hypothetical protein EUX98_g4400 [Antrodiella citrinella]